MVWDIKIAHFDPRSDGICPVGWPCQDFWENRDLWYFWAILVKWVCIFFWGPGSLFHWKCFYWEGPKVQPKTHFWASNSMGYSSYGRPKFQFLTQNLQDGRPKNAISRDSRHFSNFDVFLKAVPRGIQKPKRDLPNSCDTRDMAAKSFNFMGKHEKKLNKIAIFSNLGFRLLESPK